MLCRKASVTTIAHSAIPTLVENLFLNFGRNLFPRVDGVLKARKCGDDSAVLNSFCTLNKMTNLKTT